MSLFRVTIVSAETQIISYSFLSDIEVINVLGYTNYTRPYSFIQIMINMSVNSQFQLAGNTITQIREKSF
jgi:hypothetical protein